MKTVVDTSAIVALLHPDDAHNERASTLLHEAYQDGALRINDVVYAELAANEYFEDAASLAQFLNDTGIERESPSDSALFAAGSSFRTYLDRRGSKRQCPACGERTAYSCPACGREVTGRQHVAADFVIGGHAETDADALVTFDEGFYRDYFDVEIRTIGG